MLQMKSFAYEKHEKPLVFVAFGRQGGSKGASCWSILETFEFGISPEHNKTQGLAEIANAKVCRMDHQLAPFEPPCVPNPIETNTFFNIFICKGCQLVGQDHVRTVLGAGIEKSAARQDLYQMQVVPPCLEDPWR